MKVGVSVFILCLIISANSENLQLFSVSSSTSQIINPSGSVRGGTTIYITGLGFSANAANNQVFIGTYACTIPADGATETTLACITSDTGQLNNIYSLPINVYSNGQQQSLTAEQGSFSYLGTYTPLIQHLYPSSSIAGQLINFYGIHRISNIGDGQRDMGDVISMLIGGTQCGRFDIVQGPINPSASDTISCRQATVQEAGKYNVSEYLTPGYSIPDYHLRRASLLQENFHFAVLPSISSISPATGSVAGQAISIQGTGFSNDPTKISVSVDGVSCSVTSSTISSINCLTIPKTSNDSAKLSTNSTSQNLGYFSGAGLAYNRYDITNLGDKSINGLRTAIAAGSPSLILQESGIRGEIQTGTYFGSYYGESFIGYFTAPVDGDYVFRGVADDIFAVYLSSDYGSADPAQTPLIYSNQSQDLNFYAVQVPTAEGRVTLSAGKSYYIEVYHINFVWTGYLSVSTQVPNTDPTVFWQTNAVHRLDLSFTNDPEILTFVQTGGTAGKITLTITRKVTGGPPLVFTATINYNASINELLTALANFDSYGPFGLTGNLVITDINNTVTTDPTKAYKYTWTVYVRKLRSSTQVKEVFTFTYSSDYQGTKSFTQTQTHAHGPLISGTFTLSLNGFSLTLSGIANLKYNIHDYELQSAIQAVPGFQNAEVRLLTTYADAQYGSSWLISYYGVYGQVPLLQPSTANLLGGLAGTKPQVTPSILRQYNPNLLLSPIDYPYLAATSSKPNILVTVNGLPSVCTGDCTFQFISNPPILTLATISGSILTLSLTDPGLINYNLTDVTVQIAGQPCTIITTDPTSIGNFQCQLPSNTDLTPTIISGNYIPVVTVAQVGIVGVDPGVTQLPFPLAITNIGPNQGGSNGGYQATISGTGLPLSAVGTSVTICNQQATILSINNIGVTVLLPPCSASGAQNIVFNNGTTDSNSLTFTYIIQTPPASIFSISPYSYNPSLKGIMEINGSGFGTDSTKIRVDLANSSGKVYGMRILTLTDTYIKVGIPGGLPGTFDVQVNILGVGQAVADPTTANDFTYELVISSITPSSGSYYGGTLISLSGINFSPALDETLVFVGNQINWFCNVETVTTTQISCRTPPISPYYNISNPQAVVLTNRLMVDNTCANSGACTFAYLDQSLGPHITSISSNSITTGSVTLAGTNFNVGGATPKVILSNKGTGKVTVVIPTSSSATSVTFTLPNVETGNYNVKVRSDPIGESNGYLLVVNSQFTGSTSLSLSLNGGDLTIGGNGLPDSWPNQNFILNISTKGVQVYNAYIKSSTPSLLVVSIPSGASGTVYTIALTTPLKKVLYATVTLSVAATPLVSLTSSATGTAGTSSFVLTQSNLKTVSPQKILLYSLYNSNEIISVPTFTSTSGSITFSANLTGGNYGFKLHFTGYGWATITSTFTVTSTQPTLPSSLVSSYNGGFFSLTGTGISKSATIKVNGIKTQLTSVTSSGAQAIIPPFVTTLSQQKYTLSSAEKLTLNQFSIISDTPASANYAFDNIQATTYLSSSNTTCFIGIKVGTQLVFDVSRVRFFPNSRWVLVADYLVGAIIQGSLDQTNWTTLAIIDSSVHSGWNNIKITGPARYRYIRFSHNSQSSCQVSELEFEGILYTDVSQASLTSYFSSVTYEDGINTFTWNNSIEFRQDHTPVVSSLSQTNGDVFGGYTLTLTGTYLNFDIPSVIIDGKTCTVSSSSSTSIACVVSERTALPAANSFLVLVGNSNAVIYQSFSYVLRWSDIRTWGTDLPPVDGDLIDVPAGMNLLVDQSTPQLLGILVENGTLTFADESDIVVTAGFITVKGGQFIAGTEAQPYQHKLQFVLTGSYYGAQQPMFGNKGIGCLECKFSLYGTPRPITWTNISSTINIGDRQLTVSDNVDWQVGESIAVASTSYDHYESERKTITAISGKIITVDTPFQNKHYSGIQSYGASDKLEMRAEVGLLTRNIKVRGDSDSQRDSYGAHLMLTGSAENGFVGHVAYTEFTDCGQPKILGRYCIHFHMNGYVADSYVLGNAVHDSLARVVTLHGVHFLTVSDNVGYLVQGHNYFVEDGIETNNLIEHNLAISSIQAWTMLQTDISVASFWVTHPTNHFRYNHAAGSDFYGIWYQIKAHPDGPSASNDVCPMGNPLGETRDNVAHSNKRFGLRIFKLAPRTYPCSPVYVEDQTDPWAANPGLVGTFSGYTLYKNQEAGLLAEFTGNLIFNNFVIAQNLLAGAEFYETYFTKDLILFQNSVIIGASQGNGPSNLVNTSGIITPRLGNIKLDNIRFYNFPVGTHSLQTCSKCWNLDLFTNTAQEIFVSRISYTNVLGYALFMNGLKRQIIYDIDGTFSKYFDGNNRTSATIVNNYNHLASEAACIPTNNPAQWDTTIICDQTVKVARVLFTGLTDQSIFAKAPIKVQPITNALDTVPENSTSFGQAYSVFHNMEPMVTSKFTWALPYIAGRIYNVWWLTGLDFDHLAMQSSLTLKSTDPPILFKFNYTLNRQLYEIGPIRPNAPLSQLLVPDGQFVNPNSCENGEYYHSNDEGNRTLELCASGVNRTYFETTDVTAIYCRYLCPAPLGEFVKENFVRYWSNVTQWPFQRLPLPGENVTVNGNWTIIMDIDPAPCQFMEIDGDVIIEDTADRNIQCKSIWIRAGSLKAGSAANPFTHNINIQLDGLKNDPGYVFDPSLVGNKIFVVTGVLALYGTSPATVQTKLTASAFSGSTSISVDSSAGWAVGDLLVIAPSFSGQTEYERVKITGINGNNVNFAPALQYTHYGAPTVTINNIYGTLDTRAGVGHVTRNIKFISGDDSGWGYTLVVYEMWDGIRSRTGRAELSGVQFTMGGQYDTEAASVVFNNNGDSSNGLSLLSRSSFSYCRSFCVKAVSTDGVQISNNVFYQGRKFHISAGSISNFKISSNLLIGAIKRPTISGSEPIACIQVTSIDPVNDGVVLSNNLCQGSQGNGFVLPFISCDNIASNPFFENTAGSASVGFLLYSQDATCQSFSGIRAYACGIGQISSPPNTLRTEFYNFILADNGRGATLRFGLEDTDKTAIFQDSYITAISRPNCAECYGQGKTKCWGNQGVRMLTTTVNGEHYPKAFDDGFDVICKSQTFDCKAFLSNITFDYFRLNYTETALSACSQNVIFRPHSIASDLVGSHHLWNSQCTNCQLEAYAIFDPPKISELGWFGGCGNITCTGRNNYFIEDHTGSFLPNGGILLANNSAIGDNTPLCSFISSINGYYCTRHDFAVLEYENIAPDYNTRIMWPVNLTFEGGNYTTITNGYKEWEWMGNEPLNKRLGRFISVVQLQQRYNMTFASMPPEDMRLQFQKKTEGGNNSDWIVVKIYYPFPNSIRVENNGVVVRPISLLDNNGEGNLDTTICGSNKFFYQNYTIHFVVTGDPNCLVRVTLTNSIQLTLHFAMNIDDFFKDDLSTRLVDRMCALLQISDQSRVKIVSIYTGSVAITVYISEQTPSMADSKTQDPANTRLLQLSPLLKSVQQILLNGNLNQQLISVGFGTLIDGSATIVPVYPTTQQNTPPNQENSKVIIIAVIVSVLGAVLIVGGIIYFLKKRSNNRVAVEEIPAFSSGSEGSHTKGKKDVHNITEENMENASDVFDR